MVNQTANSGKEIRRLTQAERQEKSRSQLIVAAQDLLESNQLDTPISEICKKANVAVGTFYNYFDSKRALFDAAAIAALVEYHPTLQQIVDRFDDPGQGIIASFRHSSRLAEINPRLAKIIVNAGPKAFTETALYGTPPQQALEASVSRGLAKCSDVVAFLVAMSGAYQNILAFSLQTKDFKPEQADFAISIFARELGYSEEVIQKLCFGFLEL